MISESAIWRAAILLIRQHGQDAEDEAEERADLMLARGDHNGQLVWLRIRTAIVNLQAAQRGPLH